MASICGSVFVDLQAKANDLKSQQNKLVVELYYELLKSEDNRADENKKILQETCEKMSGVGFILPYEVQVFVEHETLASLSILSFLVFH